MNWIMIPEDDVGSAAMRKVFDAVWYLKRYPEVATSGVDPVTHYIGTGAASGYDPHPMFSTSWYLDRYPDVAAAGVNPFAHYLEHGGFERRDPHPLFDTAWYLRQYPEADKATVNPLVNYIESGAAAGRRPGPIFSPSVGWEMAREHAAKLRTQYDYDLGRTPPAKRPSETKAANRLRHALINLGKRCYARSLIRPALAFFKAAFWLQPSRRDELMGLLAKCDVRLGKFDDALAWYLRLFYAAPSPDFSVSKVVMPDVFRGKSLPQTLGVVTSLMPKRIEAQRAALRSWRDVGVSVVSVNSISEAEKLRDHFPDVTFRVAEQAIEDSFGRPLIPIQELVRAATDFPVDICGIINSDIIFSGEPSFFEAVRREVQGSLVFGCRIDVSEARTGRGQAFRNGYDFFFWEKENTALLEDTPMILGLPWWDFWLPLHAHAKGMTIKRFVTSSMVHVTHAIGYDMPAYVDYGRICAETLARVYGQWRSESMPADRVFMHRLFATAATIPVHADPHAVLSRIGTYCDLSNCLIDVMSEKVVLSDAGSASRTLDIV